MILPTRIRGIFIISAVLLCGFTSSSCSRFKTVDTSLHEMENGDMGMGVGYSAFKWRFTNQVRVHNRMSQVECIWQAALQSSRSDTLAVILGFRLFDVEGNLVDEVAYQNQKGSYPDSISTLIQLIPADSARSFRGVFWLERSSALDVVDGDIYILESFPVINTSIDSVTSDTLNAAPDSVSEIISGSDQII